MLRPEAQVVLAPSASSCNNPFSNKGTRTRDQSQASAHKSAKQAIEQFEPITHSQPLVVPSLISGPMPGTMPPHVHAPPVEEEQPAAEGLALALYQSLTSFVSWVSL